MRILSWTFSVLIGACLLAGTAGAQNSGYLGSSYSKLQDAQSPSGAKVKRWLDPAMKPGSYDKVLLDKTVLYPDPKGSDQVSASTLKDIAAYLDEALRRELTGVIEMASEPGPRTLRVKPAITGVAAKDQGLKPYEVLPVAFVFSMAKKASSGTPKEASVAVEYEVWDLDTNKVVGAGMRQGTGAALKDSAASITLASVKPVIDAWAKDARMFFQQKAK